MHGIEELDLVLSTEGTEWHGLATQFEQIGDAEMSPLCFDVVSGTPSIEAPDGSIIKLDGRKLLLADLRHREDVETDWHPLAVPKDSYEVISNAEVYEMMKRSFEGLGCKVTAAGTLNNLAKFFLNVDIGNPEFKVANGDAFMNNMCFITSHDGTYALEAYDSSTRIVCMNTFRWSRETAGEIGVKFYHTKNVASQIKHLPEYLQAVFANRAKEMEFLNFLLQCPCTPTQASFITAGYLANPIGAGYPDVLSTNAFNRSNAVRDLMVGGIGNAGKTLYDLLNGFTEYFTHHEGAGGKKASKIKRKSVSAFGMAAEHKDQFLNLLIDPLKVEEALEMGKRLYVDKEAALK